MEEVRLAIFRHRERVPLVSSVRGTIRGSVRAGNLDGSATRRSCFRFEPAAPASPAIVAGSAQSPRVRVCGVWKPTQVGFGGEAMKQKFVDFFFSDFSFRF